MTSVVSYAIGDRVRFRDLPVPALMARRGTVVNIESSPSPVVYVVWEVTNWCGWVSTIKGPAWVHDPKDIVHADPKESHRGG